MTTVEHFSEKRRIVPLIQDFCISLYTVQNMSPWYHVVTEN